MNDYYWNEYIKFYVDNILLKDTLKYHQKTTIKYMKERNPTENRIELCQAREVKKSDIAKHVIPLDRTNGYICELYKELKRLYLRQKIKVTFPIIINYSNKGLEEGIYSLDFTENNFLKYKYLAECDSKIVKVLKETNDIILSFYLNIEQALAVYGERGYIEGIEEIGYLVNSLAIEFDSKLKFLRLPEQELTHDIGLNLKKCLLIEILGFSG